MSADDQREQRAVSLTPETLDHLEALHDGRIWVVKVPADRGYPQQIVSVGNAALIAETYLGPEFPPLEADSIADVHNALPDLIAAARERDQLCGEIETAHDDTSAETGRADEAETELMELQAKVEAVRRLHAKTDDGSVPPLQTADGDVISEGRGPYPYCSHDRMVWPCQTVLTLGDQP